MFLRHRRREIELEEKNRHRNRSRFATVETGASRLQNSRFATVFFWGAHRIHVIAPAAPWDSASRLQNSRFATVFFVTLYTCFHRITK